MYRNISIRREEKKKEILEIRTQEFELHPFVILRGLSIELDRVAWFVDAFRRAISSRIDSISSNNDSDSQMNVYLKDRLYWNLNIPVWEGYVVTFAFVFVTFFVENHFTFFFFKFLTKICSNVEKG